MIEMPTQLRTTEPKSWVSTIAPTPLVGQNSRRECLIVSCPPGMTVSISQRSDVALGDGITLQNNQFPYVISYHDFGDWMQRALFAIASAAGNKVGLLDVIKLDSFEKPFSDDKPWGLSPTGIDRYHHIGEGK